MKNWIVTTSLLALATLALNAAQDQKGEAPSPSHVAMFKPLEAAPAQPAALVDLGRRLYFEKRLSKNQELSCNSCHVLDKYGTDNLPFSPGHKGQLGGRSSPNVYHSALSLAQFWDGRAADLAAQAKGPILNPVEMAMPDEKSVIAVLESIPGYPEAFAKAFPGEAAPLNYNNLAVAIAAFEKGLVTPSRFDKYLKGDGAALSAEERAGLELFVAKGCAGCHNGPALGGAMFMKYGMIHPVEELKDGGRFEHTKNEADRSFFKVPTLRNVAETAPYFHDGSAKTLDEAVRKMAWHQGGHKLSDAEAASIQTFLKSLTGDLPKEYIALVAPFPSGPKTPAPVKD